MIERKLPLAVDLDGTLISVDTLQEGFLRAFKGDMGKTIRIASKIRDGKAAFKRRIAAAAPIGPASLPYNENLIDYLRAEKGRGRKLGLFTAADQSIADAVGVHLGIFDVVRGSDGRLNLSAAQKRAAIQQEFGEHFSDAGDSTVDVTLFMAATSSILVGPRVSSLEKMVVPSSRIEMRFPTPELGIKIWGKALRMPHWAKNALVFLAPTLGSNMLSVTIIVQAVLLFVALGLLASATYLINDLFICLRIGRILSSAIVRLLQALSPRERP